MNTLTKWPDHVMMALAAVLGIGSVVLFVMMGSVTFVRLGWPDSRALAWDAALSLAFFLQHSGTVRKRFRARLSAFLPERYQGAFYAITSGVVLALVAVLWQRTETRLLALEGVPLWIVRALALVAFALFVLSAHALGSLFDPLGLGPIRAHLRGVSERPSTFVVKGPYRWVRHPLYSCVLVLIWSDPEVTADRLLFSVLWTGWICVATVLEERDLVADFGDAYRDYQRKVPMLVPWRGHVAE
ncbi:MAG: isoprenylcysteine carboxylmethyltransferase family protein [Acidobacteriia bacterium]|nr:isoprenylcysteine carboxylmethyltransferase family protein [Terriglobia bacterium]